MRRTLKTGIALGAMLVLLGLPLSVSGDESDDTSVLDSARSTLAKWVETQQIISKETKDWQVGKEILEQRIALLEAEMATLDQKIDQTQEGLGDAERRKRQLVVDTRDLEAASSVLASEIGTMETRLKKLIVNLPDPLGQRVPPLVERIPNDPSKTELTLGSRFQSVVGILNEINRFNGDITLANEVVTLPGGSKAEVQSVYVGLGQAYYVTAKGDAAGIGLPSNDGWQWNEANELAPKITEVIAILQNENVPAYVPLPVRIQ